ncbi:hypothetical protein C1141_18365, partial [Vibrio agarivorans]
YIYSSELGVYHSGLTDEESEELLLKQLEVASECALSAGYCEHALYSFLITEQIKIRETDSTLVQQKLLYLQDAYTQLEQGGETLTAFDVPLNFTNIRIEEMKQKLLKDILMANAQATPIEFKGAYATLLKEVEENKLERLNISALTETLDVKNKLTKSYLQLLQSVLRRYSQSNFLDLQMNELMSSTVSETLNKSGRPVRCESCTIKFIIEYYNDYSPVKSYGEASVADFVSKRTLARVGFDNYRIAFPHYYVHEIVPFLLSLKTYIHENAPKFVDNGQSLNNLTNNERLMIFQEIKDAIKRDGVKMSLSSVLNMTFRWLTATGQMESLLSSGVKLASLRSGQFDPGSHNKIFAVNIFTNVVLKKVPRILEGEVLRYGCSRSEWQLPAVLYMLLEDKCVFTPTFKKGVFSITASMTLHEQDESVYTLSIYHKPTNTTLFNRAISKKQEIRLYKAALGSFSIDDLILYIHNNNSEVREDIASIQLTDLMFDTGFGGVIKNNVFYFVKKLETPKFNQFRAEDYGCPFVSRTTEQQVECLRDTLNTYRLPNYFYKNMESIGPVFSGLHTSLENIIENEDLLRKEAERLAIEKLMENALSGRGWGSGNGPYGF